MLMKSHRVFRSFWLYAGLIFLAVIYQIPYYIILRNALMTQREIAAFDWIVWPAQMQWQNLVNLFNDPIAPMAIGLKNSAIISFFQVSGQLIVIPITGYGKPS